MARGPKTDQRRGAPTEYKLKLPGEGEVLGIVMKVAGASKFIVDCKDGNQRLCSMPGRLGRRFWIKANDVVIVEPWDIQGNERGYIVWRYSQIDMSKLRERGMI
jgi:translation initiation factor 1A